MNDMIVQESGKFIFNGLIFSNEEQSVGISKLDNPSVGISRITLLEPGIHLVFKQYQQRFFVWIVCRKNAYLYEVTNPANPIWYENYSISATIGQGWNFMGGWLNIVDNKFYFVETRGIRNMERRLVVWNFTNPLSTPMFIGSLQLGISNTNRGGAIEPIRPRVDDKSLLAVAYSSNIAIVDITSFPVLVSNTIKYLPAFESKHELLYGHDGDPIFNAKQRSLGNTIYSKDNVVPARWSTFSRLGESSPLRIGTLEAPGFFYDQDPNLNIFTKNGSTYALSGWTDGGDNEFISLLSIDAFGDWKMMSTHVLAQGIVPVLIDVIGDMAYVWGWPPYSGGWRYFLIPIDISNLNNVKILPEIQLGG